MIALSKMPYLAQTVSIAGFLMVFAISLVQGQGSDTIYSKGLRACLEKEVATFSEFSSRDLLNVIVVNDGKITTNLPTQFGAIKVRYLDYLELTKEYSMAPKRKGDLHGGRIPVIEVLPLYDKDGKLFFAYQNSWFSYFEKGGFFSGKKVQYYFALEGGCHAEIGYDPANKKFTIEMVELWGV